MKKLPVLAIAITALVTLSVVIVGINLHRPEKQIQRKMDHLYEIADPQFKREMGTLLGPAILHGNLITSLENGDSIFPPMLQAIHDAKRTITFETYIYWSGRVGKQFADALIERSQAGVKVYVMLDWMGSEKMTQQLLAKMKDAGIEVQRYHPLHWYDLGRLNNRTHRKLLVIDGMVGFTGGVGIADQWTGVAQDPAHWRDMHFEVKGPVVAQMQAAFMDNWIKTTGRVLHGDWFFPPLSSGGDEEDAQMFMSSPQGGSESMRLMYLTAISAANQSIDIESAYFVPDSLMNEELLRARSRGVRIRILVPGEHIDSETVRVASKHEWGPLLASGVEIYEYEPTMLHCKMLIFDRYAVSVGSTNFDLRSFELNDEASLNVYDSKFALQMTGVFENDLMASRRYTSQMWQKRPWSEKLAEIVLVPIRSQL